MEITKELAELSGIIIGDGNIHYNKKTRKYFIEITGNPSKEKEFFKHISNLFKTILGKSGTIRFSQRGIRIRVYSKSFVEFLIFKLEMHYNFGKAYNTAIPKEILKNKNLLYHCLRGIFDTDGSYFLANKGYRKDYPCIEISTCSKNLAKQIKENLSKEFRVRTRVESKNKLDYNNRHIISLNGEKETQKWFNSIGSSNNYKLNKYKQFLTSKGLNNNF